MTKLNKQTLPDTHDRCIFQQTQKLKTDGLILLQQQKPKVCSHTQSNITILSVYGRFKINQYLHCCQLDYTLQVHHDKEPTTVHFHAVFMLFEVFIVFVNFAILNVIEHTMITALGFFHNHG